MKFIIVCVCVLALGAAEIDDDEADFYQYDTDYDSFYNYDVLKEEVDRLNNADDVGIKEEVYKIKDLFDANETAIDDYQFEDNRSKSKEIKENDDVQDKASDEADQNNVKMAASEEENDANDYALLWDDDNDNPLPEPPVEIEEPNENINEAINDEILEDNFEEEDNEIAVKTDDQKDLEEIIDETKKILEETDDSFEVNDNSNEALDMEKKTEGEQQASSVDDENLKDIIKETQKILQDTDDAFDENSNNNTASTAANTEDINVKDNILSHDDNSEKNVFDKQNVDNSVDDVRFSSFEQDILKKLESDDFNDDNNNDYENDTVDKVEADLNDDLNKLFATLNKLTDSSEEVQENKDDADNLDKILDYVNDNKDNFDDYESVNDDNLSKIFETNDNEENNEALVNDNVDKSEDQEINIESNLSNIFAHNVESSDQKPDDAEEDADNQVQKETTPEMTYIDNLIPYLNDALIDDQKVEKDAEVFTESVPRRTVMVDDLSSSELQELMTQFSIVHTEDLDMRSEKFTKDSVPIHMTLSIDEPITVTSPYYPDIYPTNNVIDWVFEGEGIGIELNITDFELNGVLGDYLLVKPGGIDDSGHDGLVFSYRLLSERRYRFLDVNRMFVRFKSNVGLNMYRGFKFSVRMISPNTDDDSAIPTPEPLLDAPTSTITLFLGGLNLEQFREVEENFRMAIANMATDYIVDKNIDPGMNKTNETTQITATAMCNFHWPNFENCVEVTFGVPLVYEDEDSEHRLNEADLVIMWNTYSRIEPYAAIFDKMGISEYSTPNTDTVLMAWLVIGAGVVIAMAMLAFALWRFSCFEDYTRMQTYSDTDSLKDEKRGLDLYPTPHQTLPPLYSESEYKWPEKYDDSTRVDIGGFANRSYAGENLYDLDSEDEVVSIQDRNSVITPRDIYDV